MGYVSLKDCGHIYVGPTSVGSSAGGFRIKRTALMDERRFAGNVYPTALDTGIRNGELELTDVIYDTTTNPAFVPFPSTAQVVSVCLEGDTASARFYGFQAARVSAAEVVLDPEKMDDIVPEFTVAGEVNYGYVVAPHAARSTAGNTDSSYADDGAQAASGHAYLHVPSITLGGYDNCIVTVRHSSDHASWGDHTAFTAVTAATHEVKALATTVERYLSVSWAWTGAGSGQSITFFVGVAVD